MHYVIEEINILPFRIVVQRKIAAAQSDHARFLPERFPRARIVFFSETDLFGGKHPAVKRPGFPLVVGMHKPDMPKIRIETGRFAKPQGVIGSTLAVPARFVVKKAEKPIGRRADIQSERPDAAPGFDAFGRGNPIESILRVSHAKIQGNGICLPHIRQIAAAKHSDVPHMRMSSDRP